MAALPNGAALTADDGVEIGPAIFNFLSSPWDHGAVTIIQYALTTQLTELVTVPGSEGTADHPRTPETVTRARPHLLLLLRRWYDCILTVHRSGYSLRGHFTPASFMVSVGLQVRITLAGGIHLHHYTPQNGGLDYTSFATSVEQLLLLQESVPPHTRVWLDLIGEGVNGNEFLIRYHSSLMEARQAFDFVLQGRNALDKVRVINRPAFNQIVFRHREFIDWDVDSYCLNSYMAAAREYNDPRTGQPFQFAGDLTGVLTLARNCSEHPARHLKEFMVLIFEDDFPGAVARFQRSLFVAGLLEDFNLEITMA